MYIAAKVIIGLLLIAVILLPIRRGLLLLLLLAATGNDIVSSSNFDSLGISHSTASIWQLNFGPIRPSWVMFGCILVMLAKSELTTVTKPVKHALLWFGTVPLITGLFYGGLFSDHATTEVAIDIKFPLMLLGSILLFQSAIKRDRQYFGLILAALIGGLLARHLMDLILFALNYGPSIAEGVSRGSEDSAKGGVVLLAYFGICLLFLHRRFFLGITIAIPSVLLLAAYGTRMLWITFLLGSILIPFLLDIRKQVFYILVLVFITIGGSLALHKINEDSAEVVLARSKMITEGRSVDKFVVNVDYNIASRIDPIRYAENLNIIDYLENRLAFLWGCGYGGYYEDSVIKFSKDIQSSYPDYSFTTGKFYRAHGYPTHIFLKYGIIGLIIISSLWLIPWFKLCKFFRNTNMFSTNKPNHLNSIVLCMAAFLPTAILQLYWSGKGLFINGIIVATYIEFTRRYNYLDMSPKNSIPDFPRKHTEEVFRE